MCVYYVDKKIESYFSDRLTFSNIRSRTSRRIYRLALPLVSPETLKGTVSLYSPGALLKIEIRHFDGLVFPYTLRAPRQYTAFDLARNSRAGEMESLPWRTLCSLLISTLDQSNLQTFRRWKPYLYPVFYRSIPESRAPKLKQKKR